MRVSRSRMIALTGLLFLVAGVASAQYMITDIGTLPAPYNASSSATGINNAGQVTGISTNGLSGDQAFLYANGKMQNLGSLPGELDSQATGINNTGQVSGYSYNPATAFLFSNGGLQNLGTLGGGFSFGYAINDSGEVVGNSWTAGMAADLAFLWNGKLINLGTLPGDASSFAHGINKTGQVAGSSATAAGVSTAFLYTNGVMQGLGVLPGGSDSEAEGLNNTGEVVGSSYIAGGVAFLYSGGLMQNLGILPGYNQSDATAINIAGQVVGWSCLVPNGGCHASLYSNGVLTDLNNLLPANSGWVLETAYGINDAGQIAGSGTINGQGHAYLLSPQLNQQVFGNQNLIALARSATLASTGSGLSSYLIADGQHIFFIANNRHVHQLYYSSQAGTWFDQDLTGYNGDRDTASAQSGVCSFADSNGQYIYFVDSNGFIREYHYDANGVWHDTVRSGSTTARSGTNLSCYPIADGIHVTFLGGNAHLYQLFGATAGGWVVQDLTSYNGNTDAAGPSGALTSFADGTGQHFYFVDSADNVREYLYDKNGVWHNYNLMTLAGGRNLASTSATLAAYSISDGEHVYYVANTQHIRQLYRNSQTGTWVDQDVTGYNGTKELASSGTGLTSFAVADGQHTFFVDNTGALRDYWYNAKGNWSNVKVGAKAPELGSPLTSYIAPDGEHIIFLDPGMNVNQADN